MNVTGETPYGTLSHYIAIPLTFTRAVGFYRTKLFCKRRSDWGMSCSLRRYQMECHKCDARLIILLNVHTIFDILL